jgi:hypothetical protein
VKGSETETAPRALEINKLSEVGLLLLLLLFHLDGEMEAGRQRRADDGTSNQAVTIT